MLSILKNIVSETLEIYSLATLNGVLFVPFFICIVYLILDRNAAHDRARAYLVYPSLIIMFIIFNPVIIHLLYKYIRVEERIVRLYWPLPMSTVIAYCFVHVITALDKRWKKLLLSAAAVFLLLLGTGFTHSGQSYEPAKNAQKMPVGTKEVCTVIYESNMHEPCDVIMQPELFFWVRQYRSSIRVPYIREIKNWYTEDGALDLDIVGKTGSENGCKYVVLNTGTPFAGDVEKYGYSLFETVPAGDDAYIIYELEQ